MKDFVGYDTVVMNWLISLYGGRGFLYGVHNNELFNLNYAAEFIESTEVRRTLAGHAWHKGRGRQRRRRGSDGDKRGDRSHPFWVI